MKNAIWFSRHLPTAEQVADAEEMGYRIIGTETGADEKAKLVLAAGQLFGGRNMETEADAHVVVAGIWDLATTNGAEAIFGVPSVPILWKMAGLMSGMDVFAAWNVTRSAEGGKPTFQHRCWCCVGYLRVS